MVVLRRFTKPAAPGPRTALLMSIKGRLIQPTADGVRALCSTGAAFCALVLLLAFLLALQTVMPPRAFSRTWSSPSQRQQEEEPPHHDSGKCAKCGLSAGSSPGGPRRREPGTNFTVPAPGPATGASERLHFGSRTLRTEHAHRNGTGAPLRC